MYTVFEKNVDMRTIQVYNENLDYDETITEVMKYKHVLYAYNHDYNFITVQLDITTKQDKNNFLHLKPVNNIFSPIIEKGRKVEKENEMVCPMYLSIKEIPKTRKDLIPMSRYLNKYVNLSYSSYLYGDSITDVEVAEDFNKKVKIVGLYDNSFSVETYNECYMLDTQLKQMNLESRNVYSDEFLKDNIMNENGVFTTAIVDKSENVSKLVKRLNDDGYLVTTSYFDNSFANKAIYLTYGSFIFIGIIVTMMLLVYITNSIKKDKFDIALYKVFGYSKQDISNIVLVKIVSVTILAFLISLILIIIGIIIANNIIQNNIEYGMLNISISIFRELMFILFIFLVFIFISQYITKKIIKLEVKDILNEDNL